VSPKTVRRQQQQRREGKIKPFSAGDTDAEGEKEKEENGGGEGGLAGTLPFLLQMERRMRKGKETKFIRFLGINCAHESRRKKGGRGGGRIVASHHLVSEGRGKTDKLNAVNNAFVHRGEKRKGGPRW